MFSIHFPPKKAGKGKKKIILQSKNTLLSAKKFNKLLKIRTLHYYSDSVYFQEINLHPNSGVENEQSVSGGKKSGNGKFQSS